MPDGASVIFGRITPMSDCLNGWDEIASYLGESRRTAQRAEKKRGLPIHRPPDAGRRAPVHAFKSEIDKWQPATGSSALRGDPQLAEQILREVAALSRAKSLYRKNFRVRFTLQRYGPRIRARVETEYELINESDERQPYSQEVTIDDCERGFLESMSETSDGKTISFLKRPEITERHRGYVSYKSPRLLIDPATTGREYRGKAIWIIERSDNDFWYLHVGIPTFGVRVETIAPPDFDITPSFSAMNLLTIGQHIDIVWKRRARP
jgi:hypothetical protein